MTLDELNALPPDRAANAFRSCCGSRNWVMGMVANLPFASVDAMLDASDDIWKQLDAEDWREAFAHHPRIGERRPTPIHNPVAVQWSAGEQANVAGAEPSVQDQLAVVNRAYESRFGYLFIVSATGKTAEEILAIARQRLQNEPAKELRIAAEEQRQITNLRLQKLVTASK